MKIYLLLALFLSSSFLCIAQKLSDARTFDKVLQLAKDKQQPVMLIISFKLPEKYEDKIPVNLMLKDEEVLETIKNNFVAFEGYYNDPDIAPIVRRLKITNYPTYVFMHANKDVFYSDNGVASSKKRYLTMFQNAIVQSKEKSLSTLETEYLSNRRDTAVAKRYIQSRIRNGFADNTELVNEYVSNLINKDFNDYQTVLFILKTGPYANSKAYQLVRSNVKLTDSIYRTEPLEVRSSLNNAIINNTLASAVKTRNIVQAQAAASFARGSWGKDCNGGAKSYSGKMLSYYSAINDTTNFFREAIIYYDRFFMNISADSIKKAEARQLKIALERNRPSMVNSVKKVTPAQLDSVSKIPGSVMRKESISTVIGINRSASYSSELNTASWKFYLTGTTNINHLSKAMIWSRRAIELSENAAYYDTLAHILYRMKYYAEAEKTQELAIQKAKLEGRPYETFQDELKKIKNKLI